MLQGKKAQAAMEFLMTYGWAILVVLIVIGALAYFGVLNPQRLLPERCTFETGLSCRNHIVSASSGNMTFQILNGLGRTIIITNVSNATGSVGNPVTLCDANDDIEIKNGDYGEIKLDCGTDIIGEADVNTKYRWDIGLHWFYKDSGDVYAKIASGELFSAIQP